MLANIALVLLLYDTYVKFIWSLSYVPMFSSGKHVCCGYEDGGVRVWSLKECSTVVTMSPGHAGPVNCITVHPERGIMMTGSEDSTARLVNTTTGKVMVNSMQCMAVLSVKTLKLGHLHTPYLCIFHL